jgi:DNA repair protein RecO (recombination protein O)
MKEGKKTWRRKLFLFQNRIAAEIRKHRGLFPCCVGVIRAKMADKTHKTKGIVLRVVKYGETSLIVTILTELFGVQSYIVSGVRTSTKRGSGKANLFQPTAILDLVIYHNELKHLNRIKEFKWHYLYQHILSDVPKNSVALFMIELLSKCLKQPEANPELFEFVEDSFIHLDKSEGTVTANFPLFFALHLPAFFGFRISDDHSDETPLLDLQEGTYVAERPDHLHILEGKQAEVTSELLKTMQPAELGQVGLNHDFRRQLLLAYETYYRLHIQDFGTLKTLPVVSEVLA